MRTTMTALKTPDFVSEQGCVPRTRKIFVAGDNFGCGSSREHALLGVA
jgi:3-isopropylmalate dehydratase small subunit